MAATWLKPLHVNKGKTLLQTIIERTDYAENPDKTESGQLVASYACDPRSAVEEFLLSKRQYESITGRNQGKRDIIAYHIRQSFKPAADGLPGEITPEEALKVGYELVERFTKGKHAFIVAVHTDKAHVHCHIIFNSTRLDCLGKFNNFTGSSFAVRRLSDIICLEHGLSVIKNPSKGNGKHYGEWLEDKKPLSFAQIIKNKTDEILPSCSTFEEYIAALRESGFTVADNRKHITVCAPNQKRPTRLNSLGGEYTEEAIRARLGQIISISGGGNNSARSNKHSDYGNAQKPFNMLIDIQEKLSQGKGAGYERWAKVFNLKQAAKTLIFLRENGIDSYDDLKEKSAAVASEFSALTAKIKETETRQKEISELQKHIGEYSKTRDIYAKYKASGWSRDFYDEHAGEIILHRAAKKYFDDLGIKKLPSINQLKQEWATLAAEKKKLYSGYHELKDNSRTLLLAKSNADRILGITQDGQTIADSHGQNRRAKHVM